MQPPDIQAIIAAILVARGRLTARRFVDIMLTNFLMLSLDTA
jgi:hypothetical protein